MRNEILKAAEARIRRDGFHGFSFRDLAADVGIKSASVHYHFPTKAELGVSLMKNYHERMLAAFGDAGDERALADKLGAVGDAYRRKLSKAGMCLCGILAAEHASLPEAVSDALKDYFVACRDWLVFSLLLRRIGRRPIGEACTGLLECRARRIAHRPCNA
jgi:TetR/AcrR family transcriptional repressor of nem operon